MSRKLYHRFILICLFLLPVVVFGQISHGGYPIQIKKLKSLSPDIDLVTMPTVDNMKLRSLYSRTSGNRLKPFKFAYPFKVSLTPENSGKWYCDGVTNIWQLRIRSVGAYSLNLILHQFKIPEGAKLFLISQTSGEIKGAYTSENMSPSRILAIEPVEGDELMVQYEEPVDVPFRGDFIIAQVAHDFMGVGTTGAHRPLGISGSCNVNVNCDLANGTENIRDAVCRILIEGTELCSGTLLNNTAEDGTPYLLTANHCINTEVQAESTVFLFNYESPSCVSIDGDVSRSMSGSSLKASFDSLDFTLVRLSSKPPDYFRPYLAGWNNKNIAPSNTWCIHHPLGDIKKIAVDNNSPVTSTFRSDYRVNSFWRILQWDKGVTEDGSSGGGLFDQNKLLVGSLTGGSASCSVPTNDYFEKFALAWNYRSEKNKQLKYWLDPIDSGVQKLAGRYLYTDENLCEATTNILSSDTYSTPQITANLSHEGYWTGSNSAGYTDFAEQFKFSTNCVVNGITLGVAKVKTNPLYTNAYITVEVYQGDAAPETLLYSQKYDIHSFWVDGMNYLPFTTPVKTEGTFYVSYNISDLHSGDTLAVYMADRTTAANSFFLKNNNVWQAYNSLNENNYGSALVTELIACNVNASLPSPAPGPAVSGTRFFPNPLNGNTWLNVETDKAIDCPEDIGVFDLLGKKLDVQVDQVDTSSVRLNFAGQKAGVYFVRLDTQGHSVVGKISYVP